MSVQHKKLGTHPTRKGKQAANLIVAAGVSNQQFLGQEGQRGGVGSGNTQRGGGKGVSGQRRMRQRVNRKSGATGLIAAQLVADNQQLAGQVDALNEVIADLVEAQPAPEQQAQEVPAKEEGHTPATTFNEDPVVAEPVISAFRVRQSNGWFSKASSYDSAKIINRDHKGLSTNCVDDEYLDLPLYKYLRVHSQPSYKNREQAIVHLHKLKLKYYEVEKVSVPNMTMQQINSGDLCVARAADQRDTAYLLGEVDIYEQKKGFSNALFAFFLVLIVGLLVAML